MPTGPGSTGYQPRTTPAERRAFFDLKRQISKIVTDGDGNGNGGGTPAPNEVAISTSQPSDPAVELWYDPDATGGGGGGVDEVWISPAAPTDTAIELWFDTDEEATYAGTPIVAVPAASWPPASPQPDTLYLKVE